jgi:hypothetical protein
VVRESSENIVRAENEVIEDLTDDATCHPKVLHFAWLHHTHYNVIPVFDHVPEPLGLDYF